MSTPSLDDLFDFSRLGRAGKPEPEPQPAPRRRRFRDREVLRELRPAESAPIDQTKSFHAARTEVRQRTSQALESLGVDGEPSVRVKPERAAVVPQWRVLVRSAGEALIFFVAGRDVFDAVSRGTPAVASWMREHHAGVPWRVEAVEDLAASIL